MREVMSLVGPRLQSVCLLTGRPVNSASPRTSASWLCGSGHDTVSLSNMRSRFCILVLTTKRSGSAHGIEESQHDCLSSPGGWTRRAV